MLPFDPRANFASTLMFREKITTFYENIFSVDPKIKLQLLSLDRPKNMFVFFSNIKVDAKFDCGSNARTLRLRKSLPEPPDQNGIFSSLSGNPVRAHTLLSVFCIPRPLARPEIGDADVKIGSK